MIEVVDYDPNWRSRFEQLQCEYAAALADAGVPVIAIEHVGSTSVPRLAGKPIIDCDIVVAEHHVTAASNVHESGHTDESVGGGLMPRPVAATDAGGSAGVSALVHPRRSMPWSLASGHADQVGMGW